MTNVLGETWNDKWEQKYRWGGGNTLVKPLQDYNVGLVTLDFVEGRYSSRKLIEGDQNPQLHANFKTDMATAR